MAKDTSISIRVDSQLKEQTENILEQFGLNMTSVVMMLFRQIVRDQEIPLSLTLKPLNYMIGERNLVVAEQSTTYPARPDSDVAIEMEYTITEAEHFDRISHDIDIMGGKACIKGTRVTVGMILAQISAGKTPNDIMGDYPYLTHDDIAEALRYAAWIVNASATELVSA